MKEYILLLDDFKRTFEFGVNYYTDPTKITAGRTTGEPRGLGAILDAFSLGKLTEIGVEKILHDFNKTKNYILDFDIKGVSEVKDEPDIIAISEGGRLRNPAVFLEIKNTSDKDRWIGLTEEHLGTIKRSAGRTPVYFIYASIKSDICDTNPKTADLTGMFLKEIEDKKKSVVFQKFADLNAKCKIEFVISLEELLHFGYAFEKGMYMYETNLFQEKKEKSFFTSSGIRKDVLSVKEHLSFNTTMCLDIQTGSSAERKEISEFKIKGDFKLLSKKKSTAIQCISDVKLSNDIFGDFYLEKGKIYSFNLSTVGRDPHLKRNNIFISKRRIYQLIDNDKIKKPEVVIRDIVKKI